MHFFYHIIIIKYLQLNLIILLQQNCMDNTDGPNCELCKPGYERDGYDNCVAVEGPSTSAPCR